MSNSSEKCSCTSFEHDILSNQNNIDLFCSYLSHLSYHSQDFIKNILQHINPLYIKFYDASEKQGFYLENLYKTIRGGMPLRERPEHGHNGVRLVELALESSEKKATIPCAGLLDVPYPAKAAAANTLRWNLATWALKP